MQEIKSYTLPAAAEGQPCFLTKNTVKMKEKEKQSIQLNLLFLS